MRRSVLTVPVGIGLGLGLAALGCSADPVDVLGEDLDAGAQDGPDAAAVVPKASELVVEPDPVAFGSVSVEDCEVARRSLTVVNPGLPGRLTRVALNQVSRGPFAIEGGPTLPRSLPTGAPVSFELTFTPPEISDFSAELELDLIVGESTSTTTVAVSGTGELGPERERERFELLPDPASDILFVIDPSLTEWQESLTENLTSFVDYLVADEIDFQLGVVSSDAMREDGVFRPLEGPASARVVTMDSPNPAEELLANMGLPTADMSDNRILDAAYAGLTPPNIEVQPGFVRKDAALAIIAITDRAEVSERDNDYFLNFFLSIKGVRNTQLFSFSAVSGASAGCSTPDGPTADPTPRLVELAERSGGIALPLCSVDWSRTLTNVAPIRFRWPNPGRLFLPNQPIISTIQVFVDDVELPEIAADG